MDLNDLTRKASKAIDEVAELKTLVLQLSGRVEKQALVLAALKDLALADGLTEQEFDDRVRDATIKRGNPNVCRKCGKAMSLRQPRCIYCGEPRPAEPF